MLKLYLKTKKLIFNKQKNVLQKKAPNHIWLIGSIALFINSIGIYDIIMTFTHNENYFLSLGYGAKQIEYFANYPVLLAIFWFIGVWAAFVGSLFILIRSRFAKIAFLVAIFSQIILNIITFYFKNRWDILGTKL